MHVNVLDRDLLLAFATIAIQRLGEQEVQHARIAPRANRRRVPTAETLLSP
jgi:hypothetical protein